MDRLSQKQRQQILSYHGIHANQTDSTDSSVKELNIKFKEIKLDDEIKSYGATIIQENNGHNQTQIQNLQTNSYCIIT